MHWDLEPPGLPADNVLQQARSMVRDCALLSAAAEISCVVALLRKSVHGLQCKPARCYEAGRVGLHAVCVHCAAVKQGPGKVPCSSYTSTRQGCGSVIVHSTRRTEEAVFRCLYEPVCRPVPTSTACALHCCAFQARPAGSKGEGTWSVCSVTGTRARARSSRLLKHSCSTVSQDDVRRGMPGP